MKTIEYKGYILDIYENGKVYKHGRIIISPNGRKMQFKGSFIKEHDNGHGYKALHFWLNNKHHHEYVHRIVAIAFIENPLSLPEVNHIDGNRSNNSVSNLEWCDRKYNVIDYVSKGRGVYGDRKIKQFDVFGNFIKEHKNINLAGKEMGCTPSNINMALRGKSKTANGFMWKYSEQAKRKGHVIVDNLKNEPEI